MAAGQGYAMQINFRAADEITAATIFERVMAANQRVRIVNHPDMSQIGISVDIREGARGITHVYVVQKFGAPMIEDMGQFARQVFDLINAERAARGLSQLTWIEEFEPIALMRIQNNRSTPIGGLGYEAFSPAGESPQSFVNFLMRSDLFVEAALRADVAAVGGFIGRFENTGGMRMNLFFRTVDGEIPIHADPFNIHNLLDSGRLPMSNILLPNRQATDAERQAWIAEYRQMGGISDFEHEVARLVNEIRREHGLSTLRICNSLMMAARYYTQIMADLELPLGHNRGPYAIEYAARHGASANVAAAFGANLRWGGGNGHSSIEATAQTVVTDWMNSPDHRRYILAPEHRYIGAGMTLNERTSRAFQYLFLSDRPGNAGVENIRN
jgi:uncharacterized protein YkwD